MTAYATTARVAVVACRCGSLISMSGRRVDEVRATARAAGWETPPPAGRGSRSASDVCPGCVAHPSRMAGVRPTCGGTS